MNSALIDYLMANRGQWIPTGSTTILGDGADIDYVLCLDDIPDDIWAQNSPDPKKEGFRDYEGFVNIKKGEHDFIICNTLADKEGFRLATETALHMALNPELRPLLREKSFRVGLFEEVRAACKRSIKFQLSAKQFPPPPTPGKCILTTGLR